MNIITYEFIQTIIFNFQNNFPLNNQIDLTIY